VAPIGKPMAFRHIAAEDEHRDVDAGAVDFDFAGEEGRCGFGALGVARRLRARARRARGGAGGSGHGWLLGIQVTRSAVGDGPRRLADRKEAPASPKAPCAIRRRRARMRDATPTGEAEGCVVLPFRAAKPLSQNATNEV
jgi:hypothetical protein